VLLALHLRDVLEVLAPRLCEPIAYTASTCCWCCARYLLRRVRVRVRVRVGVRVRVRVRVRARARFRVRVRVRVGVRFRVRVRFRVGLDLFAVRNLQECGRTRHIIARFLGDALKAALRHFLCPAVPILPTFQNKSGIQLIQLTLASLS
jgi:hypothetical protein